MSSDRAKRRRRRKWSALAIARTAAAVAWLLVAVILVGTRGRPSLPLGSRSPADLWLWLTYAGVSAAMLILLALWRRSMGWRTIDRSVLGFVVIVIVLVLPLLF